MTELSPALADRRILQLGSGLKYAPEAINVDLVAATGPDIAHDLDVTPWPLPDNHFDEVWAYDVIEHLDNIIRVMEEIHRVCRPGATIRITVPHFSCANAFTDITHRHYFSVASMNYFTGENEFPFYTTCLFRSRAASIVFEPTLVNKLVQRLARQWPRLYERRWAWIFPAWFLFFELEVLKPGEAVA